MCQIVGVFGNKWTAPEYRPLLTVGDFFRRNPVARYPSATSGLTATTWPCGKNDLLDNEWDTQLIGT
jgi:hypothetical protein